MSGDKDNPEAYKPSYTKKTRATGGPTKTKQISMLVSQQVAAEMKKYNQSAHVSSKNTAHNATAEDEHHLMSMVQSAVAKHFATQPKQPNLIRRPPSSSPPPPNWKEAIKQFDKRMNKST